MERKDQSKEQKALVSKVLDTQQDLQRDIWNKCNKALIDDFLSIEEVLLCLESIKIRLMLGWKEQGVIK